MNVKKLIGAAVLAAHNDMMARNGLPPAVTDAEPCTRTGESGMCVRCKEWTDVGASCCGAGVYFEGGVVADCECEECCK